MKLNKYLIVPAIALAVTATGAYGLSKVDAAETNNLPPFVQGLAQRFGLNQDEVQNYMNEQMETRHAEMEQRHEEHLDRLVDDGVITPDQKDMLEAKHEEMETAREEYRSLPPMERRDAMHELRDEMHQWAQDNGINLPHDGTGKGMHMGKAFGKRGGGFGMHGNGLMTQ